MAQNNKDIYYKIKSLNLLMDGADDEQIKIIDETKNNIIKQLSRTRELSNDENDLMDQFVKECMGVYDYDLVKEIFENFKSFIKTTPII